MGQHFTLSAAPAQIMAVWLLPPMVTTKLLDFMSAIHCTLLENNCMKLKSEERDVSGNLQRFLESAAIELNVLNYLMYLMTDEAICAPTRLHCNGNTGQSRVIRIYLIQIEGSSE